MTLLPHHHCPLCGELNACAIADSGRVDTPCWCRTAEVSPWARAQVPTQARTSCLCARCARLEPGAPAPRSGDRTTG